MLLKRYGGGFEAVLSMPFLDGYELAMCAQDAENEERLYTRWVVGYQKEMSFLEFKQKTGGDNQPEDGEQTVEILSKVKEIIG